MGFILCCDIEAQTPTQALGKEEQQCNTEMPLKLWPSAFLYRNLSSKCERFLISNLMKSSEVRDTELLTTFQLPDSKRAAREHYT